MGLRGAQHHLKSCTRSVEFFSPLLAVCGTNSAPLEASMPQGWPVQALPGCSLPEFGHSPNLSTCTHADACQRVLRQWSTTESLGSWEGGGGCPGQARGRGGLCALCNCVTLPSRAGAESLDACRFGARHGNRTRLASALVVKWDSSGVRVVGCRGGARCLGPACLAYAACVSSSRLARWLPRCFFKEIFDCRTELTSLVLGDACSPAALQPLAPVPA